MKRARGVPFGPTGDRGVLLSLPTEVATALVGGLLARARWPVWLTAVGLFLTGLGAMAAWFVR